MSAFKCWLRFEDEGDAASVEADDFASAAQAYARDNDEDFADGNYVSVLVRDDSGKLCAYVVYTHITAEYEPRMVPLSPVEK